MFLTRLVLIWLQTRSLAIWKVALKFFRKM